MMDDAIRHQLQEDAFLRVPVEIGGYTLRPLSATSFVILKRTGNPFITQAEAAPDIDTPEGMLAAYAFVYVHAAPLPEVLRNHRDAQAFEDAVLTFAADFTPDLIAKAFPAIMGELQTAAAAIVEPEPPDDEENHDPNGQRRPGSRTASQQSQPSSTGRKRSSRGNSR